MVKYAKKKPNQHNQVALWDSDSFCLPALIQVLPPLKHKDLPHPNFPFPSVMVSWVPVVEEGYVMYSLLVFIKSLEEV